MSAPTVPLATRPPALLSRWPSQGLLTSTGLSVTGNAMVAVVVPVLVLARTGSPALAGLAISAAFAAMVPALVFGGTLIDRWGRRRISVAADLLSGAAVAALPLLDLVAGLTIVSVAALVAVGAAFDGPGMAAREALRPDVARAAGLPLERVNACGEATDGIGNVAGPALAGIGIAVVGITGTLWAAAAMFVAAAATTALSVPGQLRPVPQRESYLAATTAGLRRVWRDATLRALAVAGMLVMLFVAPLVLALTSATRTSGPQGQAGLLVAVLSIGLIVGALGYGALARRVRRRPVVITSLTLASAALAALALAPGTAMTTVLVAVVGLGFGPVNPIFAVLAQERTPQHLRGRVIGTLGSLSLLASPVGTLLAGVLLQTSGPAATFAVIALGCLLGTAYIALTPGLRHIERTEELEDQP
ncbi:MFS transporter [Micromonospora echinofusca]|uniref:Multidrug efflux pump Tap n=1 Tax=Micromonospora echinofusca TaxID=47858 RepID=A0ABS3W1C3_MICEH|nr:MFS transporter [Micromonospora echinofusca]MBO4210575.1 MFS transporter [Micromonospora echinofusca]